MVEKSQFALGDTVEQKVLTSKNWKEYLDIISPEFMLGNFFKKVLYSLFRKKFK